MNYTAIGLLLLAAACTAHNSSDMKAVEANSLGIDELACKTGQRKIFYTLLGTGLPLLKGFEAAEASPTAGIRLDICYDESLKNVELKRIVSPNGINAEGEATYGRWFVAESDQQDGLLKVLAGNDYSALKIATRDFTLEGVSIGGINFAALTLKKDGAHTVKVFGEFADFDVFDSTNSYRANNRVISIDTIRLELKYRMSGEVGRYVSYRFDSLSISDSSPALALPLAVTLTGDAMAAVLKINGSFHALNDTLEIKLPEAEYRVGEKKLKGVYRGQNVTEVIHKLDCTSFSNCGL